MEPVVTNKSRLIIALSLAIDVRVSYHWKGDGHLRRNQLCEILDYVPNEPLTSMGGEKSIPLRTYRRAYSIHKLGMIEGPDGVLYDPKKCHRANSCS